jgi:Zn-dependent metalloprotease
MKTCPFCKEQVHDEAIKCAHCQSMLLPIQAPESKSADTDRVTYVLDQGLVRFGKFVAAVLAVFLVVGGYLFGFKLEAGLERVQQTQEKSKEIQDELTKAQTDLQAARKNVDNIQAQFTKAQSELEISRQKVEQLRTTMEGQFAKASAQLATQTQKVADLSKEVESIAEKSRVSGSVIEGVEVKARAFLAIPGASTANPSAFNQDQVGRLVEIKIMTAFKQVLTNKQYSDLEKAIKTPVGLRRAIYSANSGNSLPGTLLRLEGQPATGDPYATAVYDNVGLVHQFFLSAFGRDIASDVGDPLVAIINYNKNFNNAFWNGRQLVIGDGDDKLFRKGGFGSLTVVAAEIAHAITEKTANLVYSGESGALNNHMSDVFAVLTEQWSKKQSSNEASWIMGAELLAPKIRGAGLRSLKAPGTAYDDDQFLGKDPQPGHMKDFVTLPNTGEGDNGGVHINSGIPNKAFFETARLIGGNAWEKPGRIWYESLRKLTPKTTFKEFAQVTYETAGILYGAGKPEQEAVKKGWDAVGISVGNN